MNIKIYPQTYILLLCFSLFIGCSSTEVRNQNVNSNTAIEGARNKGAEAANRLLEDPQFNKALRLATEYERTPEAILKNIQSVDDQITYAHLKKNADRYLGKPWAFTGRILEIYESGNETNARIGIGAYGSDPIYVHGNFTTDFVGNNRVYVVGYLNGSYSYTSQAGWQITIPYLIARAILTPSEAARFRSAMRK